MEHRITVRNRWKTRTHQASLTRLFDSNYFPSTADCRAATSPNFRKPRIFLFFLLSRTVRGLPALLVYSWLACCLPLPRKPRINFSRSFSTLTLFIALRLTHTRASVQICSSSILWERVKSISSLYSFFHIVRYLIKIVFKNFPMILIVFKWHYRVLFWFQNITIDIKKYLVWK